MQGQALYIFKVSIYIFPSLVKISLSLILDTGYLILILMYILENVPLSSYSTMRLGGRADYLVDIMTRNEIPEAIAWADEHNLRVIMIGGGSNIFWWDDGFKGLVMVNKISHLETFNEDSNNCYLTVGAGQDWDEVVGVTVDMGFSGIEQLSLIPGTAGATPIQNVGAYGREIKDVLVTVEAYDRQSGKFVTLRGDDCGFAYRTSRFKTTDRGRFFISSITLHLTRAIPQPPFYPALEKYFSEHKIRAYTPQVIRKAVIDIRSKKLPDVRKVANNGSFFYNPIISTSQLTQLIAKHPDIPAWPVDNERAKISAAWLVEQAGFKDVHDKETGIGTWPNQPLVLINENAHRTADLLKFKQKIVKAVEAKFSIKLEQEPQLIA